MTSPLPLCLRSAPYRLPRALPPRHLRRFPFRTVGAPGVGGQAYGRINYNRSRGSPPALHYPLTTNTTTSPLTLHHVTTSPRPGPGPCRTALVRTSPHLTSPPRGPSSSCFARGTQKPPASWTGSNRHDLSTILGPCRVTPLLHGHDDGHDTYTYTYSYTYTYTHTHIHMPLPPSLPSRVPWTPSSAVISPPSPLASAPIPTFSNHTPSRSNPTVTRTKTRPSLGSDLGGPTYPPVGRPPPPRAAPREDLPPPSPPRATN